MSTTEQTLFNPDDPRLTAYALGELTDPAERAQVEQLLAASPEARAELADLRSLTAALTAEYEQERFAAADETVAANVVAMTGADWRRRHYSLGAIAALLAIGGLAVLFALPMLVQRRKAGFGVTSGLQPRLEKMPRAQAAVIQNDARIADGQAAAAPVAATPSSKLLAQAAVTLPAPSQLPDERELVVPPGQPLPTNLPPGTKAVYGPAPVSGVVGGNPAASGTGGGSPLLFAKNKEGKDLFVSDKDTSDAYRSLPADAEQSKQMATFTGAYSADATTGGASVAGKPGVVTGPVVPSPMNAPAPPMAKAGPADSSRLVAQSQNQMTKSAEPFRTRRGTTIDQNEQGLFASSDRQTAGQASVTGHDLVKPKADAAASYNVVARDNIAASGAVASTPVGEIDRGRLVAGSSSLAPMEQRLVLLDGRRATLDSKGGAVTTTTTTTTTSAAPVMEEPSTESAIGDVPVVGRLFRDKAEIQVNTADYAHTVENAFLGAKENPLSTFSIDVDTASYAIVRRFIEAGSLPPPDAVRVEEMINYFPYADAPPAPDNDKPFAIHLEGAACPWNTAHRLVRIGIKGKEIDQDKRPPSNLVFLLDVSGSMMPEERLPLLKKSFALMVEKLREDDHVAIVVYAGESGLAMPPTSGDHKDAILHAIENLHAGGSTNGASGIKLAYQVARKGFIKGGTNRVILATDGDFNVGVTNRGDLLRLIEEERKDGVFLSVLGVGTDNLKDSTMQTLADHGNGNYNYIDRLEEGRKVLVNQMSGTLVTIAKDVKIQVEFNPAAVASYRLIGYEKRMLKKEDFNNDKIDAGEIGAGHNVTALYEVVPHGQPTDGTGAVDALKYQPTPPAPDLRPTGSVAIESTKAIAPAEVSHELLTVKMRHKAPDSDKSERSYEVPLVDDGAPGEFANASTEFRFAAAVASFGMVLRDSPYKGDATLGIALELAQSGKGEDAKGYRAGFIELVQQAQALQRERGR